MTKTIAVAVMAVTAAIAACLPGDAAPALPAPFWVEVEWNGGTDAVGRRVMLVSSNDAGTRHEFSETHPDGSESWALLSRANPQSTEWFVRAYLIVPGGTSWAMPEKAWVPGNSAYPGVKNNFNQDPVTFRVYLGDNAP
jgi:hypothetical protein